MIRHLTTTIAALMLMALPTLAQAPAGAPAPADSKKNANPCRDEVSAALKKLRNASWFRMNTTMITEKGPTEMQVDYVLPDRMHQMVNVKLTGDKSEIILVGNDAWSRQGGEKWRPIASEVAQQLKSQMQETVVEHQEDVGNYSCKGRTSFDGKDVLSYKLEDEPAKDSTAPKNEAFRMFYVDAVTGLPVSNALVIPGREDKPIFKASYAFPLDLSVSPPTDLAAP